MLHFQNCQVNFHETCVIVIGLTYHPMNVTAKSTWLPRKRATLAHTLWHLEGSGRFSIDFCGCDGTKLAMFWRETHPKWTLRNHDVRALQSHWALMSSELISPRWVRVDPIIITCTQTLQLLTTDLKPLHQILKKKTWHQRGLQYGKTTNLTPPDSWGVEFYLLKMDIS